MGYSYHPPIFNFPQNNDRPLESLEHVSLKTSRLGIIVGWHRCHGPKGANESTTSWNFFAMSAMSLNCAWIIFPYIFVWGSCFCLCTPVRSSCLLLPPPASSCLPPPPSLTTLSHATYSHTHTTYKQLPHTHTQLSHTHNLLPHKSHTHTTYRHTYTQT